MPDLVFLHSNALPRCNARVDKCFEGYHTLQFMEAGAVAIRYGDQNERVLSGRWFWAAFPGPRIRFGVAPGSSFWNHRYVAFQGPLAQRWAAAGLLLGSVPQPAPEAFCWPKRFDALLAQARRNDQWGRLRAINLLEGLLLELAEARSSAAAAATQKPAGAPPWLDVALERLNSGEAAAAPNYARIAAETGMALSTLRRRFREATGTPLHGYVLEQRLARARTLLGETDLPLKAIAERLGYTTVYFFCRQFRKQVGVPPGAFRRSRQG